MRRRSREKEEADEMGAVVLIGAGYPAK